MSLSIVSVSNVFYFRQKSTEVDLDDKKNELAVVCVCVNLFSMLCHSKYTLIPSISHG